MWTSLYYVISCQHSFLNHIPLCPLTSCLRSPPPPPSASYLSTLDMNDPAPPKLGRYCWSWGSWSRVCIN